MMRPLEWVGSSEKDYLALPESVKNDIMEALNKAQDGQKAPKAKPLKGFQGASVLEVVVHGPGGTYRCVYTVKLKAAVYFLHVFKKKSHHGISTPKQKMDLIKRRLREAEE